MALSTFLPLIQFIEVVGDLADPGCLMVPPENGVLKCRARFCRHQDQQVSAAVGAYRHGRIGKTGPLLRPGILAHDVVAARVVGGGLRGRSL